MAGRRAVDRRMCPQDKAQRDGGQGDRCCWPLSVKGTEECPGELNLTVPLCRQRRRAIRHTYPCIPNSNNYNLEKQTYVVQVRECHLYVIESQSVGLGALVTTFSACICSPTGYIKANKQTVIKLKHYKITKFYKLF